MLKLKTSLIILVLMFSISAHAYRKGSDDAANLKECRWNQAAIDSKVDCNDLFHHYHPAESQYSPSAQVRVGTYNILWTSGEKGKKNIPLNALMIDASWDVMAIQEVNPGKSGDIRKSAGEDDYILPQYIVLLQELQKHDPSWGMILSPFAQSTKVELMGFLYRGNKVQPTDSTYCRSRYTDNPDYQDKSGFVFREINEGYLETSKTDEPVDDRAFVLPEGDTISCPMVLSDFSKDFVPKIPQIARFKSGNFEFNKISLHLGFRGIDEFDSKCMGLCQLRVLKLVSSMDGDEDSKVANGIDDMLADPEVQKIIVGTEVKLEDTDDNCKNNRKFNQDPDKYNNCLDRLTENLRIIEENWVLPSSCGDIVKNISDDDAYEQCLTDFEETRKEAYEGLAKRAFTDIIFKEYERISPSDFVKAQEDAGVTFQGSEAEKEAYFSELFEKSAVALLYNDFAGDNKTAHQRKSEYVISKNEGRDFARYYQLFAMIQQAQKMAEEEETADVIMSGDYNLEVVDNKIGRDFLEDESVIDHYLWKMSLGVLDKGVVLVKRQTSINSKRELGSNYDHFIFSAEETSECDQGSAYVLNFLTDLLTLPDDTPEDESDNEKFDLGEAVSDDDYHFVMSDHFPIGMTCSAE